MKNFKERLKAGLLDATGVNLIKTNMSSQFPCEGKIDWIRLITCITTMATIVGMLIGKITPEEGQSIINQTK